jgi:hypothetical protein
MVVLADLPRASGEQGRHHGGPMLRRDEHGQLVDRFAGGRDQQVHVLQLQHAGEGVVGAAGGGVGVGVHGEQTAATADQPVHDPALARGRRHRMHPPQQQRMVGDQELGVRVHRLGRHRQCRVDGEQHPLHQGRRVAAHQAHSIPRLC